jgi:hypothetical protein
MAEPWGQFGWNGIPMLPGHLAQLRRLDELERAQQQREEVERQAAAEDRLEAWRMARMRQLAWEGRSFDPADDRTLVRSIDEVASKVFAAQDAEAARQERRALIEAGVLVPLDVVVHPDEVAPVSESGSSPAPAASRASLLAKIAKFWRSIATPPPRDSAQEYERYTEPLPPDDITRSTHQYDRRQP